MEPDQGSELGIIYFELPFDRSLKSTEAWSEKGREATRKRTL